VPDSENPTTTEQKGTPMRYMLLIYNDPTTRNTLAPEEAQEMFGEYFAFTQRIVDSGEFISGDPLQGLETATTVRVRGGKTASTDGPFAETKELLGGYYLVDCKDLDRAIELAAQIPDARLGSVEIRPIMELPADMAANT
jgi:hypothetical protein